MMFLCKWKKGDIYGIVGYSGAGKSTLVRLLNGLELPSAGDVVINGQNILALKNKELRDFRKNWNDFSTLLTSCGHEQYWKISNYH